MPHPLTKAILSEDFSSLHKIMFDIEREPLDIKITKVKSIKKIESNNDEYVYDIGMRNTNHPWFFGNNILLHNSVYFSAWPSIESEVVRGDLSWSKEIAIELYDNVSEMVSDTFPDWMKATFNVPVSSGKAIKSGREIVAETGLFIKKKRYAALVYDEEGNRQDINGKPGKIKAMGLDLRRADTPKPVQEFLMRILTRTLQGGSEEEIIGEIREFKDQFTNKKPWEMGIPKSVNRLTFYKEMDDQELLNKLAGKSTKGFTVPGHVRGAMNWNKLKDMNNDIQSIKILDGSKIIVCYLKDSNIYKMSSISYPVDELSLPDWFTSLPFDTERMIESVIDNKISNLLSVLKWDLSRTTRSAMHMESLFDFTGL